jgi:hypothetical protein
VNAFRNARLFSVAEIVVWVWIVAACTSFWTAVVIAAAFGRPFNTTTWPVAPIGIVLVPAVKEALAVGAGALTELGGETWELVLDAATDVPAEPGVLVAVVEAAGAVAAAFAGAPPAGAIDPVCVPLDGTVPALLPDVLGPLPAVMPAAAPDAAEFCAAGGVEPAAGCASSDEASCDAAALVGMLAVLPAEFMNCTICAIGPDTLIVGIPPLLRRSRLEMTICIRATTTPSISTTR